MVIMVTNIVVNYKKHNIYHKKNKKIIINPLFMRFNQ